MNEALFLFGKKLTHFHILIIGQHEDNVWLFLFFFQRSKSECSISVIFNFFQQWIDWSGSLHRIWRENALIIQRHGTRVRLVTIKTHQGMIIRLFMTTTMMMMMFMSGDVMRIRLRSMVFVGTMSGRITDKDKVYYEDCDEVHLDCCSYEDCCLKNMFISTRSLQSDESGMSKFCFYIRKENITKICLLFFVCFLFLCFVYFSKHMNC